MTFTWLLAGALLLGGGDMTEQIRFTTLATGSQSGIEEPREVVVRTAAEWKTLWASHGSGEPLPQIDFSSAMVVGVFGGLRNTGGHKVEITGIAREGDQLVVVWHDKRPPRDAIVTQALTYPYHLVQLPKYEGKVLFKKTSP
jgi:hypothetical protein